MNNHNNKILLSIRCFVYNHEPYLRQCLEGFVMQKTSFAFEAIVHDDASTDNSAAIIREYAEKYPDIIKPIYETENQYSKHDGSLRRIMDSAISPSSKYLALCEGDDYWTDPLKLQKQVDALDNHPGCTICFGNVRVVSPEGEYQNWNIPVNPSIKSGIIKLGDYTKEQFSKRRWAFHTSSYIYKKCMVNGFNEIMRKEFKDFPYGDMPLVLYCLMKGNGYYISDEMSCYRWHVPGSWTKKNVDDKNKLIKTAEKLIKSLESFDKLTCYQYHKDVKLKILQQQFLVDDNSGNVISLLSPKYWKIYDKYELKHVPYIIIKKYLPFIKYKR